MDTKQYSRVLKALSHPNRLNLFLEIAKNSEKDFEMGEMGECMISSIANGYGIGAPTISHHLKELADAGLIVTERRGRNLVARVNTEIVAELEHLFKGLIP